MDKNIQPINIADVLSVCEKYISNANQFASEYDEMLKSLVVREYLPCSQKAVAVTRILLKADTLYGNISTGFSSLGLDVELLLDGLLSYTNISLETITDEIRNFSTVDLLLNAGIDDYILQFCKRDYERLEKQIERAISYAHLESLTASLSIIDPKDFESSITKMQTIMAELNVEQLNALRDILAFNDPNLYKLKESIDDTSLDKILKMDRLEKMHKSSK